MKFRYIKCIARYFGISPYDVAEMTGHAKTRVDEFVVAESENPSYIEERVFLIVPVIGRVEAGVFNSKYEWTDGGFPPGAADNREAMPQSLVRSELAYLVPVEGDSMEPNIRRGTRVLINPEVPFIPGKVYIVIATDGRKWLKRVKPDPNSNGYVLYSDNPSYDLIHLRESEVHALHRATWGEIA